MIILCLKKTELVVSLCQDNMMFSLLFLKSCGEDMNHFTDVNKSIVALYSSTLISPAVNAGNQNSLSVHLSLWTCLWSSCFVNEVICLSNYILPPLPQCDIQINTFPLVFVRLTLYFFPVFKALLFIFPGSLSCSSSCPWFVSSYFLSYCSPLLLFFCSFSFSASQ